MIQNLNCHVNAVSNYLYIILNHILCIIPGQSSDAFIPEQEVGDGDNNPDGNKNPPEESIQSELAKQVPIPPKPSDQFRESTNINPKHADLVDFLKKLYPEKPEFIHGEDEETQQGLFFHFNVIPRSFMQR